MFQTILFTILITAPLAALITSFAEDKKQYNLWDWLRDKVNKLRGRAVYEEQITIKVVKADVKHVDAAILGLPDRIRAFIRRRV
jgi:hypothetical protein